MVKESRERIQGFRDSGLLVTIEGLRCKVEPSNAIPETYTLSPKPSRLNPKYTEDLRFQKV